MKRYPLIQLVLITAIAGVLLLGNGPASAGTPVLDSKGDTVKSGTGDGIHVLPPEPVPPLDPASDNFGYTWNAVIDPARWIEIAGTGTDTGITGDDSWAGPFDIGFPFKFYEYEYTNLYIATNGYVAFGEGSSAYQNHALPFAGEPQNIIAAFWDDLNVHLINDGEIWIKGYADKLVIEWYNVTRVGSGTSPITFEIILHTNGDIDIQYHLLSGVLTLATVGIEDIDGIDGLTYLSDTPGLVEDLSVTFTRPAPAYRVKALPLYQSKFAVRGAGASKGTAKFTFEVKNTGEEDVDTYDLFVTPSNGTWTYKFTGNNGELIDTTDNGIIDTGPIPIGGSMTIFATLASTTEAGAGDNLILNINVTSTHSPYPSRMIVVQSAIPANFAQAVFDTQRESMDIHLIWPYGYHIAQANVTYTGSSLSVASLVDGNYLYLWERNETKEFDDGSTAPYTNIQYSFLKGDGFLYQRASNLTDNLEDVTHDLWINDLSPVSAVSTSTGRFGVLWIREQRLTVGELVLRNYNVFLRIFDPAHMETPISGELNVTGNDLWVGGNETDVPVFSSPRITITSDDKFAISWVDSRDMGDFNTSNIGLAVYTSGGLPQVNSTIITSSTLGLLYQDPAIASMSGDTVLIGYTEVTTDTLNNYFYHINYTSFNTNGDLQKPATEVPGSEGFLPDVLQIDTDHSIIAWTQTSDPSGQIAYILLNNLNPVGVPQVLSTPDGRHGNLVSLGLDNNNNCVLTWLDFDLNKNIYYALVDPNGELINAPIAFYTVTGDHRVDIPDSGFGLSSYSGFFYTNLSVVRK